MYFQFSFKRISSFIIIVILLLGGVYLTFSTNRARFGNLRLTTSIARVADMYFLHVYYRMVFNFRNGIAAAYSGLNHAQKISNVNSQGIPVLIYHAIVEKPDGRNVTRSEFAEQMFALKRDGWKTVTLTEFDSYLRGKIKLPDKSFLLTFDDAAKDSFYPADPVLATVGFNAVTFVIAHHSIGPGSYYYLSSGELTTLLKTGRWEVASHGYNSHDFLPIDANGETGPALANRLWLPAEGRKETAEEFKVRVGNDLERGKSMLEDEFGISVFALAYPFGEFGQLNIDSEIADVVRKEAEETYRLAFYQTWVGDGFSFNYPRALDTNVFIMAKRIEPTAGISAQILLERLNRGKPKDLPYEDILESDKGWFSTWGNVQFDNDGLRLKSFVPETGNSVVLDGTGHWKDYSVIAKVHSVSGNGVLLWVRFADNKNNAACNFGKGFIHAEEIIKGERRVINGIRSEDIKMPEGVFTIRAEVNDRRITCTIVETGDTVTTPFLSEELAEGGIGFKVWDSVPGRAKALVRSIEVESL